MHLVSTQNERFKNIDRDAGWYFCRLLPPYNIARTPFRIIDYQIQPAVARNWMYNL
jgi:hypothetical protein